MIHQEEASVKTIESAYRPPAICRQCADLARCDFIHWPFVDESGESCPVFVALVATTATIL